MTRIATMLLLSLMVHSSRAMDRQLFGRLDQTLGLDHAQSYVYNARFQPHIPLADQVFLVYVPGDNIYRDFEESSTCSWEYTPLFMRDMMDQMVNTVFIRMCPEVVSSVMRQLKSDTATTTLDKSFAMEKLEGRLHELDRLIDRLIVKGADPQKIFLIGHSFGAWVSLLYAKRHPLKVQAVIASAPAMSQVVDLALVRFNDMAESGSDCQIIKNPLQRFICRRGSVAVVNRLSELFKQSTERYPVELDNQKHELISLKNHVIKALVFTYPGDIYNRPEDLKWLADIPGVEMVIEGCNVEDAHATFYHPCFQKKQQAKMIEFIQDKVEKRVARP